MSDMIRGDWNTCLDLWSQRFSERAPALAHFSDAARLDAEPSIGPRIPDLRRLRQSSYVGDGRYRADKRPSQWKPNRRLALGPDARSPFEPILTAELLPRMSLPARLARQCDQELPDLESLFPVGPVLRCGRNLREEGASR